MMADDKTLQQYAARIRLLALEGIHAAQSGHTGGSLSVADILAVLYFKQMHVDPRMPDDPDRDRLVLSKGHAAPAYYAALALRGYFPVEDMCTLRKLGSHLQGHPSMVKTPGVDMSSGSLGQGLSAANGMALAARYDQKSYRVYCICGDGELQEGQIWEAAMTAAHYHLDHLTLFVDRNGLQIDGTVETVMGNAPLERKFEAFGFHVLVVDGHDVDAISAAVEQANACDGRPTVIIADTVKGKGVSFMEHMVSWHGTAPDDEQFKLAKKELMEVL